jgi:uncharacterized lipoprotein YajG
MKKSLIVLAAALLFAAVIYAQTLTSVTGTVSDPSGAIVPGAVVSIVNDSTHASRQTTADSEGRYSLLQVEPGS